SLACLAPRVAAPGRRVEADVSLHTPSQRTAPYCISSRASCRARCRTRAWRSGRGGIRTQPRDRKTCSRRGGGENLASGVHCTPFHATTTQMTRFANQDGPPPAAARTTEEIGHAGTVAVAPSVTLIVSLVLATALGPLAMSSFIPAIPFIQDHF